MDTENEILVTIFYLNDFICHCEYLGVLIVFKYNKYYNYSIILKYSWMDMNQTMCNSLFMSCHYILEINETAVVFYSQCLIAYYGEFNMANTKSGKIEYPYLIEIHQY